MKGIDALNEALKIQGSDGNWNYDSYMHGMFNGLEFAVATMEDRDPVYRDPPPVWLMDIADHSPPTIAETVKAEKGE